MAGSEGPAGVGEQGMWAGGPLGTWEILSFPPSEQWLGKPRPKEPWLAKGGTDPCESEQPDAGRYRQAKETK